MSGILRRFLVERVIQILGAPRKGRIKIIEPDNAPIYKANDGQPFAFFLSGGVTTASVTIRALSFTKGSKRTFRVIGFDPEKTLTVAVDNFLKQRVICLGGDWATRADVIKYVANVASGVHAGSADSDADRLVRQARHCAKINASGDSANIIVNMDAVSGLDVPLIYDPASLDVALLELLAAAHFIISSPNIVELERSITEEIR